MYSIGDKENKALAITLLEQAVALGNTDSIKFRGYLFQEKKNYIQAVRLYRRFFELTDGYGYTALNGLEKNEMSESERDVIRYHHRMARLDFIHAIDLMETCPNVLAEFVDYDLAAFFKNNEASSRKVIRIIARLGDMGQSNLLIKIFKALDEHEKAQTDISESLIELKILLFSQIKAANASRQEFNDVALAIIDTWNQLGDTFTHSAADHLCSMIRQKEPDDLLACLRSHNGYEIVKAGTLILTKAIHGGQYNLRLTQELSPELFVMLSTQYSYRITTIDSFVALNQGIQQQDIPLVVAASSSSSEAYSSKEIARRGFFSKDGAAISVVGTQTMFDVTGALATDASPDGHETLRADAAFASTSSFR